MTDDDAQSRVLIAKAQEGDLRSFEALVARCRARLAAHVASRLRARGVRSAQVDDIVQETVLRSFRSVGSFTWESKDSFLHWMRGIAENVIHHEVRRAARHPAGELRDEDCARGTSPSRAMRREERFDRLEDALKKLPPDHRQIILLVRVEGLSFDDAARRMGRSPDAVKQLLWRALKGLKLAFGDTESLHLPDRCLNEGTTDGT